MKEWSLNPSLSKAKYMQEVDEDAPMDKEFLAKVVNRSLALVLLFAIFIGLGWYSLLVNLKDNVIQNGMGVPLVLSPFLGGGAAYIGIYYPKYSKPLSVLVAVGFGYFLGAISGSFERALDELVMQVVSATVLVFIIFLAVYRMRIVKVDSTYIKFGYSVISALTLWYFLNALMTFWGPFDLPLFTRISLSGVVISYVMMLIATLALFVDFAVVEDLAKSERTLDENVWCCAFSLLFCAIWLYASVLFLFAFLGKGKKSLKKTLSCIEVVYVKVDSSQE